MEKREWLEKEYLVSAEEMKEYDKNTIEYLKIPSAVLMERKSKPDFRTEGACL